MENSKEQLKRQMKTRTQLINKAMQGQCVKGCYGHWLACAKEVLEHSSISAQYYGRSIQDLLEKGHGKYHNMNTGVANCGKTIQLIPFQITHVQVLHGWAQRRARGCNVLNVFRWSPSLALWHDMITRHNIAQHCMG